MCLMLANGRLGRRGRLCSPYVCMGGLTSIWMLLGHPLCIVIRDKPDCGQLSGRYIECICVRQGLSVVMHHAVAW